MMKRSVLFLLCILLLFCGGCGRPEYSDSYSVSAFYSDQKLVLKLRNRSFAESEGLWLETPLDHETLLNALSQDVMCEQMENGWFLSMENKNGTTNQYFLYGGQAAEAEEETWYGYHVSRLYQQIETKDRVAVSILLFPTHFLRDRDAVLILGSDYEIHASWEDVAAFYQDSGWYDMDVQENSILFNGLRQEMSDKCARRSFVMAEDIYPLSLRYREEAGEGYVRFEYDGDITKHEKYGLHQPLPTAKAGETS